MSYIVKPRLQEILDERKISQTEFSKMCGVPQPSISRFDKNEKHVDMHLVLISRTLGITIDELFEIKVC